MNSRIAQSTAEALLCSWDSPRGEKLEITIFLGLSLVAHAVCFYIFQIVYPPTLALQPPPARVALITPDSEEGRTLLRWIDVEDPAHERATCRGVGRNQRDERWGRPQGESWRVNKL